MAVLLPAMDLALTIIRKQMIYPAQETVTRLFNKVVIFPTIYIKYYLHPVLSTVFPMKTTCDTTTLHYSLSKWNINVSKAKAEYEKGNAK